MIQTSSFFRYKGNNGISIANNTPDFYTGQDYPELFPGWDLVNKHKSGDITDEEYEAEYFNNILYKLNIDKVFKDLDNKVLLCWCMRGKFCHRRLVALWLEEELGIKVKEI